LETGDSFLYFGDPQVRYIAGRRERDEVEASVETPKVLGFSLTQSTTELISSEQVPSVEILWVSENATQSRGGRRSQSCVADNELSPFGKLKTEFAVVNKLKFCDGTPASAGSCGDVPLKSVRLSELCSNGTEASSLSFVNAEEIKGWSH